MMEILLLIVQKDSQEAAYEYQSFIERNLQDVGCKIRSSASVALWYDLTPNAGLEENAQR